MEDLTSAFLGFLLGLFAKLIYDWNLDRKEARTISSSLLLEILYMHQPTQRLLLDKYQDSYKEGRFKDLGASFWRPTFPTSVYDGHIGKIDRLLGSEPCLQLHYYYLLVKKLNARSAEEDKQVDEEFARGYLSAAVHAYLMGTGAVEAILGSREAIKEMRDNFVSLVESFNDSGSRERMQKYYEMPINRAGRHAPC